MSTHEIELRQRSHSAGDCAGFWYAVCSCGSYRSGLHGMAGHAEAAGREHAKAKNGVKP